MTVQSTRELLNIDGLEDKILQNRVLKILFLSFCFAFGKNINIDEHKDILNIVLTSVWLQF